MHVTTIGGATVDIVVVGANWDDSHGAKQDVESIVMGVGGGAVNASLAFRACGASVRIACALGCDAEAESVRATLGRESVDLSLIQSVSGLPTGKAVIHLDANAEARVFAQRGASSLVSPSRALDYSGRADLLYVTALSAVAESELAMELHRQKDRPGLLAINPSMRQLSAKAVALDQLMSKADLISLNEAEARLWSLKQGVVLPDDLALDGAAWMPELCVRETQAVLITLGPQGALFYDGSESHFLPSKPVPIRSTLGAGDAFGATLAYCWASGQPARVSMEAARAYCELILQEAAANLART